MINLLCISIYNSVNLAAILKLPVAILKTEKNSMANEKILTKNKSEEQIKSCLYPEVHDSSGNWDTRFTIRKVWYMQTLGRQSTQIGRGTASDIQSSLFISTLYTT